MHFRMRLVVRLPQSSFLGTSITYSINLNTSGQLCELSVNNCEYGFHHL
jgi:hypothetical protein